MREIASGVYIREECSSVTIGAVQTSAGWVCIDTPPLPRDARAWRHALRSIDPAPILYVINTDHHRDRTLGNGWFDAPVVAHETVAERLLSLKASAIAQVVEEVSSDGNELVEFASTKLIPPQISYTDTLYLFCGDREIVLFNRPSASRGSTWVALPQDKVLFVGDSVVTGRHPYVSNGDSKSWLEALRELRNRYAGWKIVSGREALVDAAQTEALSEYLRLARRRVSSLLRAGRLRAEIGSLVPEFLPLFPYEAERREEVQRRIRAGLDAIYDELQSRMDEEVGD